MAKKKKTQRRGRGRGKNGRRGSRKGGMRALSALGIAALGAIPAIRGQSLTAPALAPTLAPTLAPALAPTLAPTTLAPVSKEYEIYQNDLDKIEKERIEFTQKNERELPAIFGDFSKVLKLRSYLLRLILSQYIEAVGNNNGIETVPDNTYLAQLQNAHEAQNELSKILLQKQYAMFYGGYVDSKINESEKLQKTEERINKIKRDFHYDNQLSAHENLRNLQKLLLRYNDDAIIRSYADTLKNRPVYYDTIVANVKHKMELQKLKNKYTYSEGIQDLKEFLQSSNRKLSSSDVNLFKFEDSLNMRTDLINDILKQFILDVATNKGVTNVKDDLAVLNQTIALSNDLLKSISFENENLLDPIKKIGNSLKKTETSIRKIINEFQYNKQLPAHKNLRNLQKVLSKHNGVFYHDEIILSYANILKHLFDEFAYSDNIIESANTTTAAAVSADYDHDTMSIAPTPAQLLNGTALSANTVAPTYTHLSNDTALSDTALSANATVAPAPALPMNGTTLSVNTTAPATAAAARSVVSTNTPLIMNSENALPIIRTALIDADKNKNGDENVVQYLERSGKMDEMSNAMQFFGVYSTHAKEALLFYLSGSFITDKEKQESGYKAFINEFLPFFAQHVNADTFYDIIRDSLHDARNYADENVVSKMKNIGEIDKLQAYIGISDIERYENEFRYDPSVSVHDNFLQSVYLLKIGNMINPLFERGRFYSKVRFSLQPAVENIIKRRTLLPIVVPSIISHTNESVVNTNTFDTTKPEMYAYTDPNAQIPNYYQYKDPVTGVVPYVGEVPDNPLVQTSPPQQESLHIVNPFLLLETKPKKKSLQELYGNYYEETPDDKALVHLYDNNNIEIGDGDEKMESLLFVNDYLNRNRFDDNTNENFNAFNGNGETSDAQLQKLNYFMVENESDMGNISDMVNDVIQFGANTKKSLQDTVSYIRRLTVDHPVELRRREREEREKAIIKEIEEKQMYQSELLSGYNSGADDKIETRIYNALQAGYDDYMDAVQSDYNTAADALQFMAPYLKPAYVVASKVLRTGMGSLSREKYSQEMAFRKAILDEKRKVNEEEARRAKAEEDRRENTYNNVVDAAMDVWKKAPTYEDIGNAVKNTYNNGVDAAVDAWEKAPTYEEIVNAAQDGYNQDNYAGIADTVYIDVANAARDFDAKSTLQNTKKSLQDTVSYIRRLTVDHPVELRRREREEREKAIIKEIEEKEMYQSELLSGYNSGAEDKIETGIYNALQAGAEDKIETRIYNALQAGYNDYMDAVQSDYNTAADALQFMAPYLKPAYVVASKLLRTGMGSLSREKYSQEMAFRKAILDEKRKVNEEEARRAKAEEERRENTYNTVVDAAMDVWKKAPTYEEIGNAVKHTYKNGVDAAMDVYIDVANAARDFDAKSTLQNTKKSLQDTVSYIRSLTVDHPASKTRRARKKREKALLKAVEDSKTYLSDLERKRQLKMQELDKVDKMLESEQARSMQMDKFEYEYTDKVKEELENARKYKEYEMFESEQARKMQMDELYDYMEQVKEEHEMYQSELAKSIQMNELYDDYKDQVKEELDTVRKYQDEYEMYQRKRAAKTEMNKIAKELGREKQLNVPSQYTKRTPAKGRALNSTRYKQSILDSREIPENTPSTQNLKKITDTRVKPEIMNELKSLNEKLLRAQELKNAAALGEQFDKIEIDKSNLAGNDTVITQNDNSFVYFPNVTYFEPMGKEAVPANYDFKEKPQTAFITTLQPQLNNDVIIEPERNDLLYFPTVRELNPNGKQLISVPATDGYSNIYSELSPNYNGQETTWPITNTQRILALQTEKMGKEVVPANYEFMEKQPTALSKLQSTQKKQMTAPKRVERLSQRRKLRKVKNKPRIEIGKQLISVPPSDGYSNIYSEVSPNYNWQETTWPITNTQRILALQTEKMGKEVVPANYEFMEKQPTALRKLKTDSRKKAKIIYKQHPTISNSQMQPTISQSPTQPTISKSQKQANKRVSKRIRTTAKIFVNKQLGNTSHKRTKATPPSKDTTPPSKDTTPPTKDTTPPAKDGKTNPKATTKKASNTILNLTYGLVEIGIICLTAFFVDKKFSRRAAIFKQCDDTAVKVGNCAARMQALDPFIDKLAELVATSARSGIMGVFQRAVYPYDDDDVSRMSVKTYDAAKKKYKEYFSKLCRVNPKEFSKVECIANNPTMRAAMLRVMKQEFHKHTSS